MLYNNEYGIAYLYVSVMYEYFSAYVANTGDWSYKSNISKSDIIRYAVLFSSYT